MADPEPQDLPETVSERILAAVHAALLTLAGDAALGLAAGSITRGRDMELADAERHAVDLVDGPDALDSVSTGIDQRVVTFSVSVARRKVTDAVTGQEDPAASGAKLSLLRGRVTRAVLSDQTFGGLAIGCREIDAVPAGAVTGEQAGQVEALTIGFACDFETAENDPFTQAT